MRDVDAIFDAVRPDLERYERARSALVARRFEVAKHIAVVCAAIFVVGYVVSLFGDAVPVGRIVLGLCALVAAIFIYAQIVVPTQRFRSELERGIIGAILRVMEPGIAFEPDGGVPLREFEASRLFDRSPDRYRCEDALKGTVGATAVHVSEVHAEEERKRVRKGSTETYYVTIFDGLFMIADFHKHFRGTLRVLPDRAEKLLGGFGRMLQDFRPFQSEDLVYVEDPEFESEFVVYGSDQIEARYILPTSMLRRILDLKRKWRSDVRLSFRDSKVYLAIAHEGDLLEASTEVSVLSRAQLARIVSDLAVCLGLVDDLNLNTRIWSKS